MAKQPEDMVIRLLQQIQATQAEHGNMHQEHRQALARLERRFDDMQESTITALGLASHANVRHNTVQQDLDELRKRVDLLEEKL